MDWKAFLRPTITKTAVFTAISMLFIPFIDYDTGVRCFTTPCPSETTGSVAMWLLSSHDYHIYEYHLANLTAGLVLSYVLSCLVVLAASRPAKKQPAA